MKAFVIDVSRCSGCYACQIACKDEHVGNDWSPYARPQPDTGQFWLKINETVRGSVPKVKVSYRVEMCRHCDSPACLAACPVKGGIYKRHDGLVIVNLRKCTGCRNCVDACPYGAIYFNEDMNLAQKCTGCAHLLDRGWKEPRCVEICPNNALRFGEESDLAEWIAGAEKSSRDKAASPRAFYLNLPRRFIAGTVYDPATEEVMVGARCLLTDLASASTVTLETDGFGDFWFEGLPAGRFSLEIAKGGKSRRFENLDAVKDVNLGDIPLV